jgi:hypothetical protein
MRNVLLVVWLMLFSALAHAGPLQGVLGTQVGGGLTAQGSSWEEPGSFIQYVVMELEKDEWWYVYPFRLKHEGVATIMLGFGGGYAESVINHASTLLGSTGQVGEWLTPAPHGGSFSGVRFDLEFDDLFHLGNDVFGIISLMSSAAPVWGDVLMLGDQGSIAFNERFGQNVGGLYREEVVQGKIPVPGVLVPDTVSPVPEPTSLALLGLGFGLLGFTRFKQRLN